MNEFKLRYLYSCMNIVTYVHTGDYAYGGQKWTSMPSSDTFYHSLRKALSLNLKLVARLDCLASKSQQRRYLHISHAGITGTHHGSDSLVWVLTGPV